jgi:hypothetical protein
MGNRARLLLTSWLIAGLVSLPGCALDRSQWMSQAAGEQAKAATNDIGTVQQVKTEAQQAAGLLNGLAAYALQKPPGGNQQVATAFYSDAMQVSSGLQAIAQSQTDEAFTRAVFAMCERTAKPLAPASVG